MTKVFFPDRILNRNVGGNTTYTRALAKGLTKHGWSVDAMPSGSHPVATMLKESKFGRARRTEAVLHYSADTGPLAKTRGPSVLTVHGIASRWTPVARTRAQESAWRLRVRRAIRSCDRVITVSNSSADDVAAVFEVARDSLEVIPHGIDAAYFATPIGLSPVVAAQLPEEFALYVGNIEPRKNVAALVRAFDGLDLPLVVAGKFAWNFEESAEAISNSDNVIYLGFVSDDDRRALMQRCAIFTFPSFYEGFGFPVLEAMAAGAPVICSDRGSLAEVAGPARRFDDVGWIEIQAGIREALADTQWLAGTRTEGREWASRFSWDSSVQSHIGVYQSVLAQRSS